MNRNSQGIRTSIKALLSSLFTTFIVTLGFQSSLCATEQNQKTVTLGISEFASHNINELIIEDTIKTLQKALKNNKLVVKRLNLIGITNAVKSKELGLVLTSAGAFRRLVIERTGLRDLATVASDLAPNPNYADGSVFFVRRDREDIKTIADLKGRVASANYPYAFSGWQIAMGELLKQGFAPDNFFKKTLFLGHDAYPAIQAVLDKKADVGIARACFLEYSGLLEQNQLKIIGAKPSGEEFPCLHSTDLYPNWTLSTTPNTPPEISRVVSAALLDMPPIAHNLHWSVATDFTKVDKLFLDLKVGPYEYLRKFDLTRFIREYRHYFIFAALLFFGLLLHVVRVNALVIKRTSQLTYSLKREKELAKEANVIRQRLNKIQTSGVVGQMGTMIAHELKQPLATASNYCFTLRRRMERNDLPPALLDTSLEKINKQMQKATQIIDKVRSYAKGDRFREEINIVSVASAVVVDLKKSSPEAGCISFSFASEPHCAKCDEIELQIILLNILNNALEAVHNQASPKIFLEISAKDKDIVLSVSDNGPRISEEMWKTLENHSQKSSKEDGLGFGLLIVQSLAEDLGGKLIFKRNVPNGLTVTVLIPSCGANENG